MTKDMKGTGKLENFITAHDVASAVVRQITSGYGGQLIIPPGMGWLSMIRGFPTWLQESIRDKGSKEVLGANH